MYFSTRILKPVFNGNSRLIALFIVMFKIPLTALPATFIEKSGTRPILLFSSFTMILWAVLLAIGLNIHSATLSAVAMVSYVSFFSCGLGPVSWVVLSEVMPANATTAAGALGIALNWTLNFVMVSRSAGLVIKADRLGIGVFAYPASLEQGRRCGRGQCVLLVGC